MKIDWGREQRAWLIHDMETDAIIDRAQHVVLLCGSELVLTDNGTHGYLITAGTAERKGDTLIIR